jgi:uncharacterized protein (TIGR02246 family)
MKRYACFLIALIGSGGVHAVSNDEALVRNIPAQITEGWNNGDGGTIAAVYARDGVLVAGHGVILRGPADIARYHDQQLAADLKGSRLTVEVTSVRFLEPDVVVMQTEGGILWPGQTQLAAGNRGIQSFVLVKEGGAWRVKLFQNTRIQQRAPE